MITILTDDGPRGLLIYDITRKAIFVREGHAIFRIALSRVICGIVAARDVEPYSFHDKVIPVIAA